MSETTFWKCACQQCGGHLAFPAEIAGTSINCPHCGQPTTLPAPEPEPAPAAPALTAEDILAAFPGPVKPTPVSLLYQLALLLVTVTMVLLPVLYVALVALTAWGVWSYATHFNDLLTATRGGARLYFWRLMLYFGPLFVGVVLVFFMIKPLFARRAPRAQPLAVNPAAEPLLFGFIAKICHTVGAPMPTRIDLDCNLNAAASFRGGALSLLSNDLVLTIGLPLVAGLNLREFAGVIAHEFGHFTQGLAMRLSYIIRSVSFWFARVVYERDAWDVWLEESAAETEDGRIAIIVGCARLGVWSSRQVLKVLMLTGLGVSCLLLRQMEYDADSYEVKVAGSEAFETTSRRIRVLAEVLGATYKDMRTKWNLNRRLPDNFPAYLLQHDASFPPNLREKIHDTMGLSQTGVFDTHSSDGDRIRRARQAAEAGLFHLEHPATILFSNFDVAAKQVTCLHYTDDLGIQFTPGMLEAV